MDLDADENAIEFPIISAIARDGKAVSGIGMPGADDDLTPLFQAIVDTIPAPTGDPDAPVQAIVTNLDASEYLGRLAIGRVMQGTLRRGEQVALCEEDEGQNPLRRKLTQLMSFSGIGRLEVDSIRAGDLFIVAGFPEVEIGDTLADSVNPVALPRLTVDEPVLRMTFGVNTSPLAGKEGQFLTSRHLRDRLDKEILGNVSIKVEPTESPDIIEVSGRGELQLAVLIETMRREGYELQVSRPEVIVKDIDGTKHEPLERAVIDVPDEHVGTVTQALAPRKGRVTDLRPGDTGRTIVTVEAPARGLIGFRSQLLTATRGTALMHQHNAGWVAWVGDLPTRKGGAMISDRQGTSTGYAIGNLQERGEMFIGSGEAVYEGMIVGENSRSDDMMINIVREKQKTNIRTHSADEAIKLVPPREVTLENAIEFIGDDELVEVTPQSLRLRKRILKESDRRRTSKK
jgi:GTP-binding protein